MQKIETDYILFHLCCLLFRSLKQASCLLQLIINKSDCFDDSKIEKHNFDHFPCELLIILFEKLEKILFLLSIFAIEWL